MSKVLVLVGFGPGTATAVADKFGAEGFTVVVVGRNADRLAQGVAGLKGRGINAFAFSGDAGSPESIRATIRSVRAQLGPITVLHWNAYGAMNAGDLLAADPAALKGIFDLAVFGLLAAAEEALPDLKANGDGAILIANGAFGEVSPQIDQAVVSIPAMGLALASSAKHKLVGLLAQRLKAEGVFVGEVMVYATIKGTPSGDATSVDPAVIAAKHWELYKSRSETRATIRPS